MKRLLNTLYVTTEGSYLRREGECVAVRLEKETRLRVPLHTLEGIVCVGRVSASVGLMEVCGERRIAISFLSQSGRFRARVQGPVSGNVLLRREQYRRADDPARSADIARAMVVGKLSNARAVLSRGARDYPESDGANTLRAASAELQWLLRDLDRPLSLETVRGVEGLGGRTYFGAFGNLIVAQRDAFRFGDRNRRPPLDNMNALLSFLYILLMHDCMTALETTGLDPAVGFLHRDRPGRPGLALDLMEEFRPISADRLALSLVNRQQVRGSGFARSDSGAVLMDADTRKQVLVAYQKRKDEEIEHPFIGERIKLGLLPHVQAMLLARHLRGDLDGYPPFLWR